MSKCVNDHPYIKQSSSKCWLIDLSWPVGAPILKLDRDRKFLNADVTSAYPVDLKFVEPVKKHVNKCGHRIILELNGVILLKLRNEWHTTISVWARRNLTRGMFQNGSEIYAQDKL